MLGQFVKDLTDGKFIGKLDEFGRNSSGRKQNQEFYRQEHI